MDGPKRSGGSAALNQERPRPKLATVAKGGPTPNSKLAAGRLHGKGYTVGVAIGKGMGWNPSLHQKEHEKLVQKSIYSYKSIR